MQQGRAVRGLRRRLLVEPVFEDRGDAVVRQRPDLDGPDADCLRARRRDAAEQPQHTEAGPEALLRMRPPGQHGKDQRLRAGTDVARLSLEAFRRPLGIAPVRAGHVVGLGVMPRAGVAPQVSRNPLAAVEHLDGAGGGAGIDLLAEQRVRHRVARSPATST